MPESAKLQKALLVQLDSGRPKDDTKLEVQFNPDSLRVSYGNQVVQPSSSGNVTEGATQYVGSGTTRLSLTLVFDVTAPPLDKDRSADVRKATTKVIALVMPGPPEQRQGDDAKPVTVRPAPKVRFDWGSFRFDGYVDSIEESLEHFSADGRPLRSSIQLAFSTQEIQHAFDESFKARPPGAPTPGAAGIGSGFTAAAGIGVGGTVQGLADQAGLGGSWQQIAAANGIENPRALAPGVTIDLGIGMR